jgi:hypothetical protein
LSDLLDSAYGRVLLLKLLIVLPLLGVASYNAYALRPAYASRGEQTGRVERRLARMMRLEGALALGVLLVAAFLTQITPTRGTAAASSEVFSASSQVGALGVLLTVDPARPGFNRFEVGLTGEADFVEQVRLEFFDRSGGTNEARLVLQGSDGVYAGQGPFLDKAGAWQVRVNVRQSQGSDLSLPFDLELGGAGGAGQRGTFDAPVDLTTTRVAGGALALLTAAGLAGGSLLGGARQGGYIGALLRRLRLVGR